jgi:hypothetical protein
LWLRSIRAQGPKPTDLRFGAALALPPRGTGSNADISSSSLSFFAFESSDTLYGRSEHVHGMMTATNSSSLDKLPMRPSQVPRHLRNLRSVRNKVRNAS